MDIATTAPSTNVSEIVETAARLLFVTRTGERPTSWDSAPSSTQLRYLGEAGALKSAGLLGLSADTVTRLITATDVLAVNAPLTTTTQSALDSLREIAEFHQ